MSDQETMAAQVAGEDVLGRRGFFANVDRARAFGSSSLSGLLDVFGLVVLVGAAVVVAVVMTTGPHPDGEWMLGTLIALAGLTCGMMLFALSRIVTYVKACAVLLAKVSADQP